jgi:hypothetical protein
MNLRAALISLLLSSAFASPLDAQQLPAIRPKVNGVFPHGAQRGTDVEITIRGSNLQGASEIHFLTPKLRANIVESKHNQVKARVYVDPAAEPGRHDFHLVAPHGSTLAWFDVNTRPELFEKEPNNDRAAAQPIEFPLLINGVVDRRDYDYFKFDAQAGQTITFDLAGSRNDSGCDGVLSLLDENGVEIAYVDDYYWQKDPHLAHKFERSGTYYLRVFGSGEGGGPADDYRLVAGQMPHVYHAMPLGGRQGTTAQIELHGVNLEGIETVVLGEGIALAEVVSRSDCDAKIRLTIPKEVPKGVYRLHIDNATQPVPFVVSGLPEIAVTSQHAGSKQNPVPVALPIAASGIIDTPGQGHYFTFQVDEPQTILLAVDSFRFDYHLDPIVIIYDESGQRLAYQDDPTTNSAKEPANVDPHFVFALPKAGRYIVHVRDVAFRGDPNYPYRLTIKKAEPGFSAGIVGTDDTLYRGRQHIVTVQVRRLEGWNTPVEVRAVNLPPGVTGPESVIVPVEPTRFKGTCAEEHILDGTKVEYPLQIAADAPPGLHRIKFRARGEMDGRVVERELIPRYWFAPLKRIMGYSQGSELYATIADLPPLVLELPDRTTVPPGGEATVQVVIIRLDEGKTPLELRPVDVSDGLSIEPATVRPGATLADLKVTVAGRGTFLAIIEGVADGKVLARSHPVEFEVRAGRSRNEDRPDDN